MRHLVLLVLALAAAVPAAGAVVPEDLLEHTLPRLVAPLDDPLSVGRIAEDAVRGGRGGPPSPPAPPTPAWGGSEAPLDGASAVPSLPASLEVGREALLALLAAGGALSLGLGFRHVHRRNALDHPGRLAILERVRRQPGLHLRAIARATGQRPQRAAYHLQMLERLGLVASRVVAGKRCYHEAGAGPQVRDALLQAARLPSDASRRVMALLAEHPGLSQSEVARQLDMWPGQARWHLRRLAQEGALVEGRAGKALVYRPALSTRPGR